MMLSEQDPNIRAESERPFKRPLPPTVEPDPKRQKYDDKENGHPSLPSPAQSPLKFKTKEERDQERAEKQKLREEEQKRKDAEKAKREEEREQKRKLREAEKAKRDEEKRKRDEEKRKREEEKRKEQEAKQEEKRKKEEARLEDKRKREEVEAAKARQQPTIARFFAVQSKPKAAAISRESSASPLRSSQAASHDSNSGKTAFESLFLPFYVKQSCVVHPLHAFELSQDDQDTRIDSMSLVSTAEPSAASWLEQRRGRFTGFNPKHTTRDLMDMLTLGQKTEDELANALCQIPQKHLQFAEDVRPPYVGTFSKPRSWFATDPCSRAVETLNYDYYSEAEWVDGEEDGEGEDILDEDESDDSVEMEGDDMEEFVASDDTEPRRNLVAPMAPVIKCNDGSDPIFYPYSVEVLLGEFGGPIDPFKDYWTVSAKPKMKELKPADKTKKKTIPDNCLKPILEKIHGQDSNQILLVEILKKDFPQYSKEAIRNTLKECARRIGEKEQDKRWEVIPEVATKFDVPVFSNPL